MLTEIKEREKQSLTSAELNVIDWINENEEKRSQQVRCKLPVVGSDTTLDDIVVHHHDEHLHESDKSSRRFRSLRTFSVPV